jgi:hypothetical protein
MFEELARDASESAREPTVSALMERYAAVTAEIQEAFNDWSRPLDRAADAVFGSHQDHMSGKQAVLARVQEIRNQAPWLAELISVGTSA